MTGQYSTFQQMGKTKALAVKVGMRAGPPSSLSIVLEDLARTRKQRRIQK